MDPELQQIAQALKTRYKDEIRQILFFGEASRDVKTASEIVDSLLKYLQPPLWG